MRDTITRARDRFAAAAGRINSTWNVQNTDESRSARLHLYGVIGGYWGGIDVAQMVPAIRDLDVDTLEVFINSPGGDVYDGIALRNALRQHPARVVVTIDGLAASAASFIACAGDEVVMGENAEVMIHDAWSIAVGDAEDMRVAADDLDRLSDNIAAMYAAKAGGDAANWRSLMKAETWYSAAEAVAVGLADRLDADGADDADAEPANVFDLSMYARAGRTSASAQTPAAALATDHHREDTMTTITAAELDRALALQSDQFDRTMETRLASITAGPAPAGPAWPSVGAFIKDLSAGSQAALDFYTTLNAYEGATTGDTSAPNTWVRDAIRLINRRRTVLNTFTQEPLPADGMNLEFLQLQSDSISVKKQAGEGADLATGKVVLKSDTTPVETYGGWTELSQQIIDRASAQYVTTANTAMDLEYARATEAVVRDLLKGIIKKQHDDGSEPLSIAANANAYAWLDLLVDAVLLFDDRGYVLDGSFVDVGTFKKLIRLEDTNGNSLMRVWGQGINQVGELDLSEVTGGVAAELGPVQFRILPSAEANTVEFHDRVGITTWESAGAPFKLQDKNILNLTEAFSKYGYLAAASQFPGAIAAAKVSGAAQGAQAGA